MAFSKALEVMQSTTMSEPCTGMSTKREILWDQLSNKIAVIMTLKYNYYHLNKSFPLKAFPYCHLRNFHKLN